MANKGLLSPRLAVIWDPDREGRWALNASYARYVMPMTSNVAASTTAAGNAAVYIWLYQGPAINPDPTAPLVTSDVAIERVFDWFDANGGIDGRTVGSFVPGKNIQIQQAAEVAERRRVHDRHEPPAWARAARCGSMAFGAAITTSTASAPTCRPAA